MLHTRDGNINLYIQSVREPARCREAIEQANRVAEAGQTGDYEKTIEAISQFNVDGAKEFRGKTLADKIRKWILLENGYFSVKDIYNSLGIVKETERGNVRVIVHSLYKKGELDKHPSRGGFYRRIEEQSEPLDWINAPEGEYPITLPLGLSSIVQVLPKSIICIAGTPNSGKTSICLDTIRVNMDKLRINYFSSELGAAKLKNRLSKFENVEFPLGWHFHPFYRSSNFPDSVKPYPDDLNIIDYVELAADVFMVGDIIKGIFDNLDKGIAIVVLQKKFGADMGRGAEFSLEKPSLYVSIEKGWAKIVKCKEFRGNDNPNGKVMPFRLRQGWEFNFNAEDWRDPEWHPEYLKLIKRQKGIL
jgi:hypothetical protein